MQSNMQSLINKKFGKWTVVSESFRKGRATFCYCLCACGTKKAVWVPDLQRNLSRSCGCARNGAYKYLQPVTKNVSKISLLYSSYKYSAKKKHLQFALSPVEFHDLVTADCVYCGRSATKSKPNGIDRYNNAIGYTLANSVPCCRDCNLSKGVLPYVEFQSMVERIYERQNVMAINRHASPETFNYLI